MLNKTLLKMLIENSELGLVNTSKAETLESFAQFIKALTDLEVKNTNTIMEVLGKVGLVSDNEASYNNLPISILYRQLPAVINGSLLVKVVILEQGENIAVIIPDEVAQVYEDVQQNNKLLSEKNIGLSLYAEVYGFDSDNKKFQELIKTSYLAAGNFMKAFDLVGADVVSDDKEDDEKPDRETNNPFETPSKPEEPEFDIPEAPEDIATSDEVAENMEAYNKFKTHGNALGKLAEALTESTTTLLKKNTKVWFLNSDKNILIIEVNNKAIYDSFHKAKSIAKQTISKLGESIRANKDTQLLDSFSKSGKRYFVVAENILNDNFWYAKGDELTELPKLGNDYAINPIASNIIQLNKSSIRKESRVYKPFTNGSELKVVFMKASN
jgi:hypothetical protein